MISFVYVTCSSKDYTAGFGATPYEGSYTPQIHDAFNRLVYIRTCVCVCVCLHIRKNLHYAYIVHIIIICINFMHIYTHIHTHSKVNSCILDGEMVGWDPETESFL